ncbi:MAG TPA: CDGSH iron-sulfur domain-containing protein [Acidimicrobiales bacterium]|nr:CDGSH iron-sulfur domain-containing protein [Acidimicrobiales bacterium]
MSSEAPSAPSITVTPHGPYLVRGLPVRRQGPVESEHGEPLTWRPRETVAGPGTAALCRCGASGSKPFCDGSHTRAAFDGTEGAPTSTYDERATIYPGTRMVVRDDRSLCEHAGFCGTRASTVWKMLRDGSTADTTARSLVMAMVERCPSGALTYRVDPEEADIEPALAPAVAVLDDGPLLVTGGVTVARADGAAFEARNRMTLCRCGASDTKPLCDGSHRRAGFEDH